MKGEEKALAGGIIEKEKHRAARRRQCRSAKKEKHKASLGEKEN